MVTTNLECALRHIRESAKPRTLWIDAICINQSDLDEKSSQVAIMGNIYQRAIACLLWLGPAPCLSPCTLEMFQAVSHEERPQVAEIAAKAALLGLEIEGFMTFLKEFEEMLSVPTVWSRVWVLQEVALARRVSVLYGPHTLKWSPLLPLLVAAGSLKIDPKIDRYRRAASSSFADNTGGLAIFYARELRLIGETFSFTEIYYHFDGLVATDSRDLIYGLLGIVDDDLGIKPDYNLDPGEVFTSFVQSHIKKHNDLNPLELAGAFPGREDYIIIPSLPTWVPNFPTPTAIYVQTGDEGGPWYRAGLKSCYVLAGETEIFRDAQKLMLLGIHLDTVQEVTSVDTNSLRQPLFQDLPTPRSKKYFNGQSSFDARWRTLMFDVHYKAEEDSSRLETAAVKAYRYVFSSMLYHRSRVKRLKEKLRGKGFKQKLEDTTQSMLLAMRGGTRQFWYGLTQSGYMAMFPDGTQKDDIVCILYQGRTPFVLRPSPNQGENTFLLIGPTYVHGFMDGEALTWLEQGKLQERTFVLV